MSSLSAAIDLGIGRAIRLVKVHLHRQADDHRVQLPYSECASADDSDALCPMFPALPILIRCAQPHNRWHGFAQIPMSPLQQTAIMISISDEKIPAQT